MPTIGTLFSGGELVGVGARNAGLSHLWGYEYKDEIAAVARLNGFNTITADVLTLDPREIEVPDVLHASPVCTRASQANTSAELNAEGTKEHPLDIAMAEKVSEFIRVMRPCVFTLENVYAYRKFKAFKKITDELSRQGYMWDFNNCNSADFSVPQIRRRLILRAVRDSLLPPLPEPEPWRGWFQAIEDLISTCPETQFAPWQLRRIPENLKRCAVKAFIADQFNGGHETSTYRMYDEPIFTQTVYSSKNPAPRAFILGPGERSAPIAANDPSQTITGNSNQTCVKAWIIGDQYSQPQGTSDRQLTVIPDGEPSSTIRAYDKGGALPRGLLQNGKVIAMTPRCLARFQSVPDDYMLPSKNSLACLIIGNGVPPLMYEKIIRQMI